MTIDTNSVTISGRLTKDVHLRKSKYGDSIATFTIASVGHTGGAGYFDVVAYDQTALSAHMALNKGDGIEIKGRLQQRRYERDGINRYSVEIAASDFRLI